MLYKRKNYHTQLAPAHLSGKVISNSRISSADSQMVPTFHWVGHTRRDVERQRAGEQ